MQLNIQNEVYTEDYSSLDNSSKYLSPIIIDFLKRNPEIKGNIVDIGCGKGGLLRKIKKAFNDRFNYFGIDYYFEPIENEKKEIIYIKKDINADFSEIEEKFDVAISTEVIEHVVDTDAFITNIKKLLKPNGILIITTPNLAFFFNRILLIFGNQPIFTEISWKQSFLGSLFIKKLFNAAGQGKNLNEAIFGHLRVFTFRALEDFVKYHGFSIIKKKGTTIFTSTILRMISRIFTLFPRMMPTIVIIAKKEE